MKRGSSSIAPMKSAMPAPVIRIPWSRVWMAARRVTARIAMAGRIAPQSPSRKPMIVVERMAMTRRTMPEEARMAVSLGE